MTTHDFSLQFLQPSASLIFKFHPAQITLRYFYQEVPDRCYLNFRVSSLEIKVIDHVLFVIHIQAHVLTYPWCIVQLVFFVLQATSIVNVHCKNFSFMYTSGTWDYICTLKWAFVSLWFHIVFTGLKRFFHLGQSVSTILDTYVFSIWFVFRSRFFFYAICPHFYIYRFFVCVYLHYIDM